ncbi:MULTISPECIES: DUF2749 domain-containing protein [Mesorhizobium]|uniref:Uncharacterized protein n=1 Tax=Mesorhizobium delmotii TaxID=1631247 RepID=A0A2P9AGK6_9HYPH|nr:MULTISPECIES: DUF2749 domain-containing protein [Mesorhizobium]SJM30272.1 conserved hypothetical protein [Mesorhizobium delmotii]
MTRVVIIGAVCILATTVIVVAVVMSRENQDSAQQGRTREFFDTRTYDTSGGETMRPEWKK